MLRVSCIVGTRPNLIKIAPILRAFDEHGGRLKERFDGLRTRLVHTGQHYDNSMSNVFFEQLGIPQPDVNLGVADLSTPLMIAATMHAFAQELQANPAELVMIVGDVNAVSACSQAAAYMQVPVAHIEAGLRSFDLSMPEELNRMIADRLASLHFATCDDAVENLLREGVRRDSIRLVGNVMIDTLLQNMERMDETKALMSLPRTRFILATLHRPSNVDDVSDLKRLLRALAQTSSRIPVLMPAHPRTQKRISEANLQGLVRWINTERLYELKPADEIWLTEPLGYLQFQALMSEAAVVVTDSGGLQEETTYLRIPCITVRENTERPVTITHGSNRLVGNDYDLLQSAITDVLEGRFVPKEPPHLWDGHAAKRIVDELIALPDEWFSTRY
jgi:UDP-N-acetylglucosamine 2-epimerase (non-hydrolysing)